jgi:methylated-DNA-[protein]-cysteine S-methyltransferase
VGDILLLTTEKGLSGLYLATATRPLLIPDSAVQSDTYFVDVLRQLQEYFAGKRTIFTVEFDLQGTEFQKKVWNELYRIPFGEVISYKELAQRIGQPTASRAVGTANGKNPVSIIIPCHRVIAADRSLGGYGWGLPVKKQLLQLEKVVL